jgi:hypothetical protein
MMSLSDTQKARAEAAFKRKETQAREGATAWAEYEAKSRAVAKTWSAYEPSASQKKLQRRCNLRPKSRRDPSRGTLVEQFCRFGSRPSRDGTGAPNPPKFVE